MGFKLGREKRGIKSSENIPVLRKSLNKGILGEANNDGTVFISKKLKPGSALERKTIKHETQHVKDMQSGILGYGDDWVRYKGKTYPRKDGKIKYNGKWHEEGSMNFPWEQKAKKAE